MGPDRGFALPLVLATFLLIGVIGLGAMSVAMSDTHGAVAYQLAMQATNVAEGGLHYGAAQLIRRAVDGGDAAYRGEPTDVAVPGPDQRPIGFARIAVRCVYPVGALPPSCADDPSSVSVDERDLRSIASTGLIGGRPARARRRIEAVVRRYRVEPGDLRNVGACGRDGVDLTGGSEVTADIGSNGTVVIEGSVRGRGLVRARAPLAPVFGPTVHAVAAAGDSAGLTGAYSWRVTFIDAHGQESGGSPPTPILRLAGQYGALADLPAAEWPVVRRRLYRTAGTAPLGSWYLVGEVAANTTAPFTDTTPDHALRWRIPGRVEGRITTAGTVECSVSCARLVEGRIVDRARAILCPAYRLPPVRPGREPAPHSIVQSLQHETMHWSGLLLGDGDELTVETPSDEAAQLHIHLRELRVPRGATVAVTGAGTVYFHVAGRFTLEPGAVFGASDFGGRLITPPDRVHVLVAARDPDFAATGAASVRWERANRVAAVVVAPDANIVIDRAEAISGALFGRHIRIDRSTGIMLDPVEGMGSERSIVRPSPYQYLTRWFDSPRPLP